VNPVKDSKNGSFKEKPFRIYFNSFTLNNSYLKGDTIKENPYKLIKNE